MAAGFQAPGLLKLGQQQQQTGLPGPMTQNMLQPQTVAATTSHTVLTIGQTAPQTAAATTGGLTTTTTTGLTGLKTGLGTTGLGTTGLGTTGLGTTGLGTTGLGTTGLGTTGLGTTGQTGLTGLGTTGQTGLPGLNTTGQTRLTGLTTTAQTGLKTGLTGTTPGLGGGVTNTTGSHVTGLGGASNGVPSKTKIKSVSEGDVPVELSQLITQFEVFMTAQKKRSDEISKSSETFEKKFRSLGDDIDTHQKQAVTITQQLNQLNSSLSSLKEETIKEGQVIDVAQRTRELPAGLQHENTAPDEYFQKTVIHFEKRMQIFRNQLEELESYLHSTHPMDSGDILGALDAQYKPFLLLAARLQVVHEEIQRLKEQYVSMRRLMGLNNSDLFVREQPKRGDKKTLDTSQKTGPSPFAASIAQATAALTAMATAGGGGATTGLGGMGTGLGGIGTGLGGIGTGLGGMGTGLGGMGTGLGGMGTGLGGMGTSLGGMGTGLGGMGGAGGRGIGTGIGGMGTGMGTGLGRGIGMGTGTGMGLGTGLGGGMGTGLGGMGTGLGGMGTGLGGMGTGLGGMGTGLGGGMGAGLGGMGTGLGGGMGTGLGTGLSVAGTTKPFQLKPPPVGKRKT